jgi:hypothetical protein
MQTFLLVSGSVLIVLGLLESLFPAAAWNAERSISPKWLLGTIPQMWNGREVRRSRFIGALFLIFGILFVLVGVFWPAHINHR